eukprot:1141983-Pelagomonas_calceolata.AAC.2
MPQALHIKITYASGRTGFANSSASLATLFPFACSGKTCCGSKHHVHAGSKAFSGQTLVQWQGLSSLACLIKACNAPRRGTVHGRCCFKWRLRLQQSNPAMQGAGGQSSPESPGTGIHPI